MPLSKLLGLVAVTAALVLGGCASVQSTAFPLGAQRYAPKPAGTEIFHFKDTPPKRAYIPVARLNVHIEKTFFISSALTDALPQLEALARQQGADALIDFTEKQSRLYETYIYNVTATAIVFTEQENPAGTKP